MNRGTDFVNLGQLDQKLWVALACPTTGVEFDATTLSLIDTDKDGRVRAPELIAAVQWAVTMLKNPDDLLKGSATLRPAAINDSNDEGKLIAQFARKILGKADHEEVTFGEAATAAQTFASKPLNGDGIIPADSVEDEFTKGVVSDIIACVGLEKDASGKPGVSQAKVDLFFGEAAAFSDWWKKAEGDVAILPLGLKTEAAAIAVRAVRAKVEDFFVRGRLAEFDPRSVSALNRDEEEYALLGSKELTSRHADIASLPLAQVSPVAPLPLIHGLNPAWSNAMADLVNLAVKPLLGDKTQLTETDWQDLVGKLSAFEAWNESKAGGSVEKIGLPRVREILASKSRQILTDLIALDQAEQGNSQAVLGLHRLIHYHRDLGRLCRNFVNFADFYGRKDKAIFQAGTLYLDQRSCDLCLTVDDAGKHAVMAGMAGTYLAYCDCVRKGTGEKMSIVAGFTGGDSDNLMVGRNGIFYDRSGRDWDATITKIVDNPISIRQAFWSPYKKLVRMLEERAAKQAADAEAAANAQLSTLANAPAGGAAGSKRAFDPSVIALISVALGSLAAAGASILVFLGKFEPWQIPLIFAGVMLVISAPSMAIAWLKLRKRNLGPILDANGWAVNSKARMNVPFGGALTSVASLPPGAVFGSTDAFAEKPSLWPKILSICFAIWFVWSFLNDKEGRLYRWTDGRCTFAHPPEVLVTGSTVSVTVKPPSTGGTEGTITNAPVAK